MADVTDIQGYQQKFEGQLKLLDEADIDDRDRDQINKFVIHLRASDPSVTSLGTVIGHLNRIRMSAERSQKPLMDFDSIEDVEALKLHLEDVHGLSTGTIRNYMKAVRKFFKWREADFASQIVVGAAPTRKYDPKESITSDELQAMFDACAEFDLGVREKALIALLRDAGLRIGAALSLQVKHLNFDTGRSTITINTDANVKGAAGEKPITWSRGYIANWLDSHPRPYDPDAPLFHKVRQWDPDGEDDGALTYQYAARRLSEIAEIAGIDRSRMRTHLFRGTAISEWILDDMHEQKIKYRMDWDKDSRMFGVYSRITDQKMNDAIFDHYGIEGEEAESIVPELNDCPQCKTTLRGSERFCPACATPLRSKDVETVEEVEDASFESMAPANVNDADLFSEFRRRFNSQADFRERVVGSSGDAHDESS